MDRDTRLDAIEAEIVAKLNESGEWVCCASPFCFESGTGKRLPRTSFTFRKYSDKWRAKVAYRTTLSWAILEGCSRSTIILSLRGGTRIRFRKLENAGPPNRGGEA